MKKVLWFDTETTGLSPVKNDIIQIAGLIELDGEVIEEFNIKCQPTSYKDVQQRALDVNGITIEQLRTFQTSLDGCDEFLKIMEKHNNGILFTPAGHNVKFDVGFLSEWLMKNTNKYNSYTFFTSETICTKRIAQNHPIIFDNNKLTTIAEHFGIEYDAHDALADIQTTRKIYQLLTEKN